MANVQDLRSITPRSNGTRPLSAIKHIARHHSATAAGDWFTFWPYWNKSRGWGTGGYAEIILRDGTVQLCYDPNEITNGIANHNSTTYHICVVGNGSFTDAQEKAWEERALLNMKRFGLSTKDVKGHREFSGTNTACPGVDMDVVRKRLVYLLTHTERPVTTPVSVPKKEENELLEKAIVISSAYDYPAAEVLSVRLDIPIYPVGAIKGIVAKELILVGADKKGLKADKITDLSGKHRFDTVANVEKYLK